MRKIYLFLSIIVMLSAKLTAQQAYYKAPAGTATTNVRAPNGSVGHTTMRGAFVVTASELAGISTVTQINGFGFNLIGGTASTPVTGTIQVYLQNTSDVTYTKGNNWSTIITGMTSVYNNAITIPSGSTIAQAVNVLLPSPFTYTGGGMYVAYDWISSGPFETSTVVANYQSETNIPTGGASSASSSTTAPTTLGLTNFRPNFNFGYINTFTNEASVQLIKSHGKIPLTMYAPYSFTAVVKNMASVAMTNVQVDLSMSGANNFTTTTTIPNINPGATLNAVFPAFTATAQGMSTITVSVLPDENNANNVATTSQSVTCETLINTPATFNDASYNSGVGFNTASGIIYNRIRPTINTSVTAINVFIANNAATVGKPIYCVLGNSGGTILAWTNTITITAPMLSSWQTFYFANPVNVLANTNYHSGLAIPAGNPGYFPLGAATSSYVPTDIYYTSSLTGGFVGSLTQNLGYFGMETLFYNGIDLTVTSPTVCSGTVPNLTLTANGATNYTWSTGANTSTIGIITPSATTNYTVKGTDALGNCYVKKIATVLVNITPTITVPVGGICPVGGSHTFVPTGAATYTYEGGSDIVSPTVTTTYSVAGTSSAGCISAPVTTSVIVTNSVNLSILTPTGICVGTSGTLTGQGAATYSWSNGSTLNPIVVSPTVSTTYGVLGTVGTCTAYTTDLLIVNPNPTVNLVMSNTTACTSGIPSVTLTATGATTYSWSFGSSSSSVVISPTATAGYSVIGTDLMGCKNVKNFLLPVSPSPTITASTSDSLICINKTATLTATGGVNYVWSNNTSTTSVAVVSPTTTTIYTVTGYGANGCANTFTIEQVVDPCAGIKEVNGKLIRSSIYPNPTTGIFNIAISEISENTILEIYNQLGQLVVSHKLTRTLQSLDVSGVSNGMYFIKIKENNQIIDSFRLIKN